MQRFFALEGAKVIMVDIQEEKASEVLNIISELGGEAIYIRLGITDRTS